MRNFSLILFTIGAALAQDRASVGPVQPVAAVVVEEAKPAPIPEKDKSEVKDIRFLAAMALARLNDAKFRRAQADLDTEREERALAGYNSMIDQKTAALRLKCNAPDALFAVNDAFEWIRKPTPAGGIPTVVSH